MVRNSEEPSYKILICLIKIWDMEKGANPLYEPYNAMTLTEVQNIEISESYTKLISQAKVDFPRGTVIRQTILPSSIDDQATDNKLKVGLSNSGVVATTRGKSYVADPTHFNVGQRIRIYLGYTTDPAIANIAKANRPKSIYTDSNLYDRYKQAFVVPPEERVKHELNLMFDGYITKVSVDSPVSLTCENLASELRQITCSPKDYQKCSVNALLGDGEESMNLLEDTSLRLHPDTAALNLQVGHTKLSEDKTVADIIEEWTKFGVYTFVTEYNGRPVLQCARAYFIDIEKDSVGGKDSILNVIKQSSKRPVIKFDYHVVQNGLTLQNIYKGYIAVEAEGITAEGKRTEDHTLRLTICNNPDYDGTPNTERYRILNESKLSKKMAKKGFRALSRAAKDKKNDLSLYTKIPYFARQIPVTRQQLLEEALKYMDNYNFNGIDGTLTIFGDLHLHTGYQVELKDDRYPNKNGYYLVENVTTTFGTGGYRQTISLPYCLKRFIDEKK